MQTDESASQEICHYNLASIFNGLLSLSPCDEPVGVQCSSAAPHTAVDCCSLYAELTSDTHCRQSLVWKYLDMSFVL